MALLKVAHLGNPVLRKVAQPVATEQLRAPELQLFIDDLIDTMREYDGVGLAAPQVHQSIRIVVYEVAANPRYPDTPSSAPLTVLVNPVLTPLTEQTDEDWEGCLSLPDLRGRVPRTTEIRVEAQDREGRPLSYIAKEFHARVVQHECDHLDGRVFLDRMTDMSTLHFLPEFQRYALDDDDDDDDQVDID
jgi:peptide deformylase